MPRTHKDAGQNGGFEAGPGCGPFGIVFLVAVLIALIVLVNKGVIPL